MKLVVPVKSNSTRVKNKNFRDFWNGLSLTDILIQKLLFLGSENIYISSNDPRQDRLAQKYNCNFLLRDEKYCDNDTPLTSVIRETTNQVPYENEIAWCQVTDPMFDDYAGALRAWQAHKHEHDSLCVVYPFKKYILNSDHMPINFGFGNWHTKSQNLKVFYDMTFTFSILKREAIASCGYQVGCNPYWYDAYNNHIDIDTEEDFEIASMIYDSAKKRRQESHGQSIV